MVAILIDTRRALHLNQRQLGERFGAGLRTVQRWHAGKSTPSTKVLYALADRVRPEHPALAAELESRVHEAYRRPPPPEAPAPLPTAPAAPTTPRIPRHVLVDSVVCAAAEAASVIPSAVRPAVLAAFERARDAGLSLEDVVADLTSRKAQSP